MIRPNRLLTAASALLLVGASAQYLQAQVADKAGAPAVLAEVPDDAQVVITINNVKGFSNKISNAATRMNLPVPQDIVGTLTRNIGITKGFDQAGSVAFVLLKGPQAKEGEDATPAEFLMLLPASDPKAMLESFKPSAPEKGISEVTLPNQPDQKGYVSTVGGKFVAFAESKDALAHYLVRQAPLAKRLSAPAVRAFTDNDVVVYANMPEINKAYSKQIDEFQQMITSLVDLQAMAGGDENPAAAAQHATQKEAVLLYFSCIKQFMSDANSALLTTRLSDAGANFGLVGDFKPDSPFGRYVAAQKPARALDLKGLPTGDYLAAGAFAFDPKSTSELFGTMLDRLTAAATKPAKDDAKPDAKGPDAAAIKRAVEIQKQELAMSNGGSFVFLTPPDGGKNGWFYGAMLLNVTDPAKYIALQRELIKNNATGMESLNPEIKNTMTLDPNGPTVGGIKFDKVNIKVSAAGEDADKPGTREAVAMAKALYGPNGMTGYIGAVGNQVLAVFGDEKLLEASVAAVQKKSDALATHKEIAASKDQVVKNPMCVVYMPVERWIALGKKAAGMSPEADKDNKTPALAIGEAAAPMVLSIGVDGPSMNLEIHVPMSTMTNVVNTVKDVLPFMGGMMP